MSRVLAKNAGNEVIFKKDYVYYCLIHIAGNSDVMAYASTNNKEVPNSMAILSTFSAVKHSTYTIKYAAS